MEPVKLARELCVDLFEPCDVLAAAKALAGVFDELRDRLPGNTRQHRWRELASYLICHDLKKTQRPHLPPSESRQVQPLVREGWTHIFPRKGGAMRYTPARNSKCFTCVIAGSRMLLGWFGLGNLASRALLFKISL